MGRQWLRKTQGARPPAGLGRRAVVRAGSHTETAVASGCVEQEAGSQDRRKEKSRLGLITMAVRIKHSSSVLGSGSVKIPL